MRACVRACVSVRVSSDRHKAQAAEEGVLGRIVLYVGARAVTRITRERMRFRIPRLLERAVLRVRLVRPSQDPAGPAVRQVGRPGMRRVGILAPFGGCGVNRRLKDPFDCTIKSRCAWGRLGRPGFRGEKGFRGRCGKFALRVRHECVVV